MFVSSLAFECIVLLGPRFMREGTPSVRSILGDPGCVSFSSAPHY